MKAHSHVLRLPASAFREVNAGLMIEGQWEAVLKLKVQNTVRLEVNFG